MSIRADSINIELNNRTILKDVSLNINQGEIISVIGPNGAGKSTLLKSLAGDIKPSEGDIYYDQKNIMAIDIQERAFTRSVMSQLQQVAFDFSVKEIIERAGLIEEKAHMQMNLKMLLWKLLQNVVSLI